MTPIVSSSITHLNQLKQVLQQLSDAQYTDTIDLLGGSSVGKHTRHVVEFFSCLINGLPTKSINYDTRERNLDLETSREFALEKIETITSKIKEIDSDVRLWLAFEYGEDAGVVDSSLYRELVYNIEHTVHHLAIIRIGVTHAYPSIAFSQEIGYASSTLKHLKQAQ